MEASMNRHWSDEENDTIVADYFAMLHADLAGERYSKAEHNRALRGRLDRSEGSIRFKHQNISAVLKVACPLLSGPLTMFGLNPEGVDHGTEAARA